MTWMTWRRYRVRMVILALYVLALVVFMIVTERAFQGAVQRCVHSLAPHEIFNCPSTFSPGGPLNRIHSRVASAESGAGYVATGIALLPIIVGVLFGTPLIASEIEAKTNRLAWTQSVTRTRWFLTSWLTLAIPAALTLSLLAFIVQWWVTHVNSSLFSGGGLIQQFPFMISGVDPIAFTIFALSFGAFVGVVLHRFVSPYPATLIALAIIGSYVSDESRPTRLGGYWEHQWSAAGIFLAMSAVLIGITVVAVRRWRT